ncbi:MAG TPA: L-glyceraldehyde 3-phosphate reductase [Opitutaceae bacterium]|jgi:L-glyceraldehyde 3-phosphate reductase|nr:L-glyceraldehyde 3-phosphate reductase [Opitutaceae bacterium]
MYEPDPTRYSRPSFYRRCGRSGLKLPQLSLGLWHNFGTVDNYATSRAMVFKAFDLGITHFDIANNYGPPPGSAETHFGRILKDHLAAYRDELIISTKAGYDMWAGPYGERGSRKYLLASLDQSLKRLGIPYVDIFYSHRFDPETPLEETMGALAHAVRSGKALYAGVSNYGPAQTEEAARLLRAMGAPCLIHQPKYHMFDRTPEQGLLGVLAQEGIGGIAFCPLAQGLLTSRYLKGIPADSRAGHDPRFLKPEHITKEKRLQILELNRIAQNRGQTLAQMALAWVLRQPEITSALIGASRPEQIEENVKFMERPTFDPGELAEIDRILSAAG